MATLAEIGEFGLIERLLERVGAGGGRERTLVGPGDDAAVRRTAGDYEIWTTDTLVAGVHFPANPDWRDLGWKALAVNVSDIAAMGGVPDGALVTLALPPEFEVDDGLALYRGLDEACAAFGATVLGGDVVRSPVPVITVALNGWARMGESGEPLLLRRDAALAGNAIAVTGQLGAAAAGARILLGAEVADPEARRALVSAQQRPLPRLREAHAAAEEGLRCAIDVSDGLLADLGHICEMSGAGATVWEEKLPASPWLADSFPNEALALAVAGGEDYELLLVGPEERLLRVRERVETPLTIIGEITDGPRRVRMIDASGREVTLPAAGWDHFGGGASS